MKSSLVGHEKITHKQSIALLLFILFFSACFMYFMNGIPLKMDEHTHSRVIRSFLAGNFDLSHETLTTLPGYNFCIMAVAYPLKLHSIFGLRVVSLCFSLLAILFSFLISNTIDKTSSALKTLQVYFIPILFPFLFLIYTDALSLFLVLLSLYLVMNKKYDAGGIVVTLSIVVRQNNIIWLAFMCLFIYCEDYNTSFSVDLSKNKFEYNAEKLKAYFRGCRFYILGIILFAIFVIVNKGVALYGKSLHPSFVLHLGNTYFSLFLAFLLFLPLHIANLPKVINFVNKKVVFALLVFFLLYIFVNVFAFNNTNPLNLRNSALRNSILIFFTSNLLLKILYFIIFTYAGLSLAVTKLSRKSFYLIYPTTILYLLPLWLIDPRYHIIPLTLFIIFKERSSKRVELTMLCYLILLSLVMFFVIVTGRGFP